jgi:hypothetical protein
VGIFLFGRENLSIVASFCLIEQKRLIERFDGVFLLPQNENLKTKRFKKMFSKSLFGN